MIARAGIRILLIFAALAVGYYAVLLPAQCNRALKVVEIRTRSAMQGLHSDAAPLIARENVQLLTSVGAGCRQNFEFYLLLALNKKMLGRLDGAIADLTQALEIADRPEIYFDRGLLHLEAGRLDAAVSDLATAIRFNRFFINRLEGELRSRVEEASRDSEKPRNPPAELPDDGAASVDPRLQMFASLARTHPPPLEAAASSFMAAPATWS